MRRLASVLVPSSRRSDKSDAPSSDDSSRPPLVTKKSRVFLSLSRKHLSPLDSPPLVATDLANSSSSSSSGSTTLRTPDDDGLPPAPNKKGSWKSWLGRKNATVSDRPVVPLTPPWQSLNVLRPSKSGSNEADDVSSHSDDPYGTADDIHIPAHPPEQMASARANARTLIMNSLIDEPVASPLFQSSGAIAFPRSCHSSQRLRRRETLESGMHKKLLLARLDRLLPSAELSIASLATKTVLPKPHAHPNFQDDIIPRAGSVNRHSSGLENWVSRPCFEDRQQLWTRSDSGEIIPTRVPGSQLGVAALEFSDLLELLAGTLPEGPAVEDDAVAVAFDPALEFALPPLVLDPDPPVTQMNLEPFSPPINLSRPADSPAKSPPPQPRSVVPALSNAVFPTQQLDKMTASGSTASNDLIPKRGVRFADDDGKDDQIPLGYVLRIRKNKEQKARFLREERERRARAAQLSTGNLQVIVPPKPDQVSRVVVAPPQNPSYPLISLNEPPKPSRPAAVSHVIREEERLRREAERVEMEKLRRSRELAKKQAEERERTYAEELQATRARREAARAGRPLESASFSPRASDRDRSASRDSIHVGSLRRSSIKYTPELVFSPVSPQGGSPSSSLPATPGSQYSFSRPPSLYSAHTTSSEDVRGRDGNRASRRLSAVSDPAKGMLLHPPYDPRISFNPYAWSSMPPVSVIPPVPSIPAIPMVNGVPLYGMDMPLLPPTAPFMVDRFGAGLRSYSGSSGLHTPPHSSTSLSRNYSSEGIDSSSRGSSSHSFGSHQRHSSDEATRMAKASGESRSASYIDVRGIKASPSHLAPLQNNPRRSSWVPPEKGSRTKSSLGPVSGAHSPGAASHTRRRTAAS